MDFYNNWQSYSYVSDNRHFNMINMLKLKISAQNSIKGLHLLTFLTKHL